VIDLVVNLKYFSYGSTTAVITSLAIIVGFSGTVNAVINIVTALIIIAIADNISDSLGIHMHQESEESSPKEVRLVTYINFF
jgi:vacuolar iron transporter family protein